MERVHTRPRPRLGFSLSLGLEIAASRGVGMEAGGFPLALCLLGALALRAGGPGAPALTGQVDFFPLSPSPPACCGGRVYVSACVRACLSLGFLLFVILGRGGWEGLSCWRFQIDLVQAGHSCCGTATFLVEIQPQKLRRC